MAYDGNVVIHPAGKDPESRMTRMSSYIFSSHLLSLSPFLVPHASHLQEEIVNDFMNQVMPLLVCLSFSWYFLFLK